MNRKIKWAIDASAIAYCVGLIITANKLEESLNAEYTPTTGNPNRVEMIFDVVGWPFSLLRRVTTDTWLVLLNKGTRVGQALKKF